MKRIKGKETQEAGILLHLSCLPGRYGIGTMGKEARRFIDFLRDSHQKYWQVLPLGPCSYGDSPYRSFSAFAGNPYFIDLDLLEEEGLLTKEDLNDIPSFPDEKVDYGLIYQTRDEILRKAYDKFSENSRLEEFEDFCTENKYWLDDYAVFMTLKGRNPALIWTEWEEKYRCRFPEAMEAFLADNVKTITFQKFVQFMFFKQWYDLKRYAEKAGIEIIGDLPIYVDYDSCDVWSNPGNWLLDKDFQPLAVAGVPPDDFSPAGQLWGNPLYDYKRMKRDNYSWWIDRFRHSLRMFDVLRIDHFRGFAAFYAVPGNAETAESGIWIHGPGKDLFKRIKKELGKADIIAENLGFLTKDVSRLLKYTGYRGMKVLQFSFDDKADLPIHWSHHTVAYSGTHDNMTLKQWLESLEKKRKDFVYRQAKIESDDEAIEKLILYLFESPADRIIIPLTDYLEAGEEARFNVPGTSEGNWCWRLPPGCINEKLRRKIETSAQHQNIIDP